MRLIMRKCDNFTLDCDVDYLILKLNVQHCLCHKNSTPGLNGSKEDHIRVFDDN